MRYLLLFMLLVLTACNSLVTTATPATPSPTPTPVPLTLEYLGIGVEKSWSAVVDDRVGGDLALIAAICNGGKECEQLEQLKDAVLVERAVVAPSITITCYGEKLCQIQFASGKFAEFDRTQQGVENFKFK